MDKPITITLTPEELYEALCEAATYCPEDMTKKDLVRLCIGHALTEEEASALKEAE